MTLAAPSAMVREIREAPAVVARVLDRAEREIAPAADAIRAAGPAWAMLVARGTSDHAATYARYLLETEIGIPTGLAAPSVTTAYGASLHWSGGLVVAISQSGRSDDLVAVLSAAREAGALTVAITNDPASPLAGAGAWSLACHAGPEQAVPATKTYVAELAVTAALVAAIKRDGLLHRSLGMLPDELATTITVADEWLAATEPDARFDEADRALVISRGFNLATALEIGLKLKETSRIFADAYSAADFAHGPLALAGPGVPAIAVRPDGPVGRDIDAWVDVAQARGSEVLTIGGREAAGRPGAVALDLDLPEALTPLAYVIPGQLLVHAVARRRGIDPDAPEGLRKVTRTR